MKPRTGSSSTTPWPLVGREQELGSIEEAYADATGGVVLVGEPGVGRTRLAYEALSRLSSLAGSTAWWVPATRSAAAVPLSALAPLLPPAPEDLAESGRLDAMRSLLATFAGGAGRRPVVAVDDAHLLDDPSAALLFQLAAARHAFVVLTATTGAPVPDAVTALWRTEAATRIDVPALSLDQVGELLPAVFAGPVDAVSVRELGRTCAGNPLLLRELVLASRATGAVRQVAGVWRWTGRDYVTDRLAEVVGDRLGPLDPAVLSLGELLACGETIPLSMLESLTDPAAVVAAERSGLVAVAADGARLQARLAHPIYAGVIAAAMPRSRQREVSRALAVALAATPMRRYDDPVRAARWRERAGLASPPDLLLTAAGRAAGELRLKLAERLARTAQRTGGGPAAALLLAEALCHRGWYAEAARALPASADGLAGSARAGWEAVRSAVGYWTADRGDRAGPAAGHGWWLLFESRPSEALRVQPVTEPDAAVVAAGLVGRDQQAGELFTAAAAAARDRRTTVPWGPTRTAVAGCLAMLATGRLEPARELADGAHRDAVELVERLGTAAAPLVGAAAAARGTVARAQGRAADAVASLGEATALLTGWHTFRLERLYHAELAAAHALLGDLPAAREQLAHADRLGPAAAPVLDAWVERAWSWVTAASGDLTRAAAQAMTAGDLARATEQPTIEAFARLDAVRFGATRAALARLTALAGSLRLPAVSAMARFATALGPARPASELDAVAHTLAGLGHLLYAAEAATAAHARHAQAGHIPQANASMVRAAALMKQCGEVRTPLLTPSRAGSVLTSREFQVARLAAAGHSSATIADRLGLSTRTVNNYLGRVYHRLGINRRTQLASVLAEAAG